MAADGSQMKSANPFDKRRSRRALFAGAVISSGALAAFLFAAQPAEAGFKIKSPKTHAAEKPAGRIGINLPGPRPAPETGAKATSPAKDNASAVSDNKTVAAAAPAQPAQYTSFTKRDPFMPLLIPKEIIEKKSDKKKSANPLEDYAVSDMQLTAVMWSKDGYYALIKLPDGKSYTVRQGMALGANEGRIYKITRDSVIIKEKIKDDRGRLVVKENPLKLRRGEE